MMGYSFDLSYYLDTNMTNSDVYKIVEKYPDCKWYATDIGPFGKSKSRKTRNNGYNTKNIDQLINLIKEINETNGIFFDFIHSYAIGNSDDGERIYASPNALDQMCDIAKTQYFDKIQCLTGHDLEIFNLIVKK
jgi:hypothetical protein